MDGNVQSTYRNGRPGRKLHPTGVMIEIKGCTTNDENSTSTGATIDAGGQPMAIRHGVNVGCDAFLSQDQSWA